MFDWDQKIVDFVIRSTAGGIRPSETAIVQDTGGPSSTIRDAIGRLCRTKLLVRDQYCRYYPAESEAEAKAKAEAEAGDEREPKPASAAALAKRLVEIASEQTQLDAEAASIIAELEER